MRTRRPRPIRSGTVALLIASAVLLPGTVASARSPARLAPALGGLSAQRSALVGTAPTGHGPSAIAVDHATHTIYVANGNNANGPNAGGDTVSVIDARRCDAHDVSRCTGPWPTIAVGQLPSGVAIDPSTDTIYVSNTFAAGDSAQAGPGTVSVIDGATCNAEDRAGCRQTPVSVPVGSSPLGLFADPADHTIYVPNLGSASESGATATATVSMIDSATCTATNPDGCPTAAPPTVDVGSSPQGGAVDPATHTVYITTIAAGPHQRNGWAVLNADTCNATTQAGCGQIGRLPGDPAGPFGAVVDDANHTLYTSNYDNTVSAYDLSGCNAADLPGCATDRHGTVTFAAAGFGHDLGLVLAPRLHALYVANQKDDTVMVIATHRCNGTQPARCAALTPHEIHTGADPELIAFDPSSETLYVTDEVDDDVSVIDPARCDAAVTAGCRARVPEVPVGPAPAALAADPAVATTYVAMTARNTISMINNHTCNAHHRSGCGATPPRMTVGSHPAAVAVNSRTGTVYVADVGTGKSGTVAVFGDRGCNAIERSGCRRVSRLTVPAGSPVGIAVNPRTDTIYVATVTSGGKADLISVFDGGTCDATVRSGCRQKPGSVSTGGDGGRAGATEAVAVNPVTNTVYATNDTLGNPFLGRTVYMIDGRTCHAQNMSGCGHPMAKIPVGTAPGFGDANPFGIAVDQATDTIYTADIFNGEGPGAVSVINGATCNAHDRSGCGRVPARAPAGFGTTAIALDPATHRVYAADIQDAGVTTINATTCDGSDHRGCRHTQTRSIVGDYPSAISVDGAVGTAYVSDAEGVSVLPVAR